MNGEWLRREPPASAEGAWDLLTAELDAWAAVGRTATFWWRDDDAAAVTPALDRLFDCATGGGVPLALAVVPRDAAPALAAALPPGVAVMQHGWSHANHAPPGSKKAELGDHRPLAAVMDELRAGRDRLRDLFAGRAMAVVVPPWNRIGDGVAAALPGAGFTGLSVFGARTPADGPPRCNTHVDPIDWHGGRGFVGTGAALDAAIAHLRARRLGRVDPDEPTGILTHHLDHGPELWDFVGRFVAETRRHPAAAWPPPEALFRSGP